MTNEQLTVDKELVELARSVFADAGSAEDSGFDTELWKKLEQTGLARLTLPEAAGGSDGVLSDLAAVLEEAGASAARVPVVETDLLGGWLAHAAGLSVPIGPLTAVVADLNVRPIAGGAVVSGTVPRVPWARAADAIVVLAGQYVVVLDRSAVTITEEVNLAEEPRDTVTVVDLKVEEDAIGPAPTGAAKELRLRAALGRALLLAGAARGAVAGSVRYAGERVQFGRPIGKFQAIQQQVAVAAAEVAAATAAAHAAALMARSDGFAADSTVLAIAAAKARAGEAAGVVARIAHQVHGAIGFTREHDLRLLTTRLWAWREEDGSDAQWNDEIGVRVLEAGADGLWPLVTGSP